jgi:hypothetical protein
MSDKKELTKEDTLMSKHDRKKNEEETSMEAISFQDWFVMAMKLNKKIEAHHYDSLLTFAKTQNLTETEPSYKYDASLKKFGF